MRKIKNIFIHISILFCFLILVFFASFTFFAIHTRTVHVESFDVEIAEEVYPKINTLSMVMTGDVLIHRTVYLDAAIGNNQYDFTKQMKHITPMIKEYDLAYYNQETIIGGKELGISTYPLFNSPDEIGDCMIDMGFNLVSLATNHTLDKGEKGVLYSVDYWKQQKNVLSAGQYSSFEERNEIRIEEKNNITYTMLSYTTITNGLLPPSGREYLTNIYSDEKAKEDIERVRNEVDVVFVAMHWGTEYYPGVSNEQDRIANYLSELGVDVIIGTHPHVLGPIERINNTVVFYSLGNFISAQIGIERLTGVLASLNITKTEQEDGTSEIHIDNINTELIYTHYNKNSNPWNQFKVIPYKDLTDEILPNYKNHYEKYASVLKQLDDTIPVTSLE